MKSFREITEAVGGGIKIANMSSEQHKLFRQNEAAANEWHAAHPVHHMNIVNHFNQATKEEKAHGMNWYKDAHYTSNALAKDTHTPKHTMAGLIANYSPQTHWHTNILTAARVGREKKALGGHGSGVFASGQQKIAAQHKPHVVVDRHAYSVAAGARMTDAAFGHAGLKSKKKYGEVSDAYVHAAKHISEHTGTKVEPHQVQAVTWLVRQRLNAAEEKVNSNKRNVGKTSKTSQDHWLSYAKEHHPNLIGHEPGTGYGS
jgi:hypothetical protein